MPETVAGLPVHALVVHATAVVVPTAALAVLLAAVWPRFRRWAFAAPFALAVVALVLFPITVESGELLMHRTEVTPAVLAHTSIGEDLEPWVWLLALVATVQLVLTWRERRDRPVPARRALAVVTAVLAVVAATGTVVTTVRIGHAGATAVWSDADETS